MSEITKEELLAMIDVQVKSASAMENIANSIRQMTDLNKEVLASHKELIKTVTEHTEKCQGSICSIVEAKMNFAGARCAENKTLLDNIDKNIFWVKITAGSIGIVTALALALTKFTHWIFHSGAGPGVK